MKKMMNKKKSVIMKNVIMLIRKNIKEKGNENDKFKKEVKENRKKEI